MQPTIVLFTRDFRVHDHPALVQAAEAGPVVPLFVLDDALLSSFGAANRVRFLLESLEDLRASLQELGGELWIKRGDTVAEVHDLARRTDAKAVYLIADASSAARLRLQRLRYEGEFEVNTFPGISVIEPGEFTPQDSDHYRVFTPYLKAWLDEGKRTVEEPPRLQVPSDIPAGAMPALRDVVRAGILSPNVMRGGESAARARALDWFQSGVDGYLEGRDDLAADATSRLSPYLHFGCISANELVVGAPRSHGGREFVRQLVWRDFFLQVLAAAPDYPRADYRESPERWIDDDEALTRWREGMTGVPLVDAGMRQLLAEGWMHNRARLVTGSFLTRHLKIDWRAGARHFWNLLVDGDVASNAGNWQWVAGTGNATRRTTKLNPLRQAKRFDRSGEYVRRYVPELADLETPTIHEPWRLGESELEGRGYPLPLTDVAPSHDSRQVSLL